MRLIDADEFDTYLEKRMFYESHRNHAYLKGIRDCRKDLAAMHTIEAEPVKHGHWIVLHGVLAGDDIYGDMGECSNCGLHLRNWEWNYCPNCGADMRGEQNG